MDGGGRIVPGATIESRVWNRDRENVGNIFSRKSRGMMPVSTRPLLFTNIQFSRTTGTSISILSTMMLSL